jgi:hypothetical protein
VKTGDSYTLHGGRFVQRSGGQSRRIPIAFSVHGTAEEADSRVRYAKSLKARHIMRVDRWFTIGGMRTKVHGVLLYTIPPRPCPSCGSNGPSHRWVGADVYGSDGWAMRTGCFQENHDVAEHMRVTGQGAGKEGEA